MFRLEVRHAATALAPVALVLAFAFAFVLAACNQPQRRNDWRSPTHNDSSRRPAPPATCATDADCAASRGTCVIELGARAGEGTCTTPPGLAPFPRGDGGPDQAPAPPGVPNVQPSPGDIHL